MCKFIEDSWENEEVITSTTWHMDFISKTIAIKNYHFKLSLEPVYNYRLIQQNKWLMR